jgi:hypothetical protein
VPTLRQALQDLDRGHLAVIAELWGLPASAARQADRLAEAMLLPQAVAELAETLSDSAQGALHSLQQQGGRLPMAELTRQFGPLREMGPGKRDREKPWRHPVSALEELWYRGLVGRAFYDTPKGPEEFAFIPQDLLPRLPQPAAPGGPPSEPAELVPRWSQPAGSAAVDDATTLLAALRLLPSRKSRLALEPRLARHLFQPDSLPLIQSILQETGLVDPASLEPDPGRARRFLEAPRGTALGQLLQGWAGAQRWNDLAQVERLRPSKARWPNEPLATRQTALAPILRLRPGRWWSLAGFLDVLRRRQPGFLRPGGDFDSWYLQDAASGEFLSGVEAWDRVEAALLTHLLAGPLHWLGVVDLGGEGRPDHPGAFRLTPAAKLLLAAPEVPEIPEPRRRARLSAEGRLTVPREAARPLRYQIARFGRWIQLERQRGIFLYQLTPSSLRRGQEAGLQPRHMLAILREATGAGVPRSVEKALQRWGDRGPEAELSATMVLRVANGSLLEELKAHPTTARYLGETLGPTRVEVRRNEWQALCGAALRRGILIDWPQEDGEALA